MRYPDGVGIAASRKALRSGENEVLRSCDATIDPEGFLATSLQGFEAGVPVPCMLAKIFLHPAEKPQFISKTQTVTGLAFLYQAG